MGTRLLMLVLTVGAFIAMWSGDHQVSIPNNTKLEGVRNLKGTAPGPKLPIINSVKVSLFWEEAEAESDPIAVSDSTETVFSMRCFPESTWVSSKHDEHDEEVDSIHHAQIIASSLKTEDWDLTSIVVWSEPPEAPGSDSAKTIPEDVSVSFDPIEPMTERIHFVKENLEIAVSRAGWFFSSIQLNVKSSIRETAGALAGMTAEVYQRTRQHWERAEDISTKPARVATPVNNILNANRFRCRRFY